jgi:hypothetical protein
MNPLPLLDTPPTMQPESSGKPSNPQATKEADFSVEIRDFRQFNNFIGLSGI